MLRRKIKKVFVVIIVLNLILCQSISASAIDYDMSYINKLNKLIDDGLTKEEATQILKIEEITRELEKQDL